MNTAIIAILVSVFLLGVLTPVMLKRDIAKNKELLTMHQACLEANIKISAANPNAMLMDCTKVLK